MTIREKLNDKIVFGFRYHAKGIDPHLFTPDIHDGFEILHICSGTGHVTINNRIYELKPKTIFFINGCIFHYSNPDNVEEYIRNGIHFNESIFTDIMQIADFSKILEPFVQKESLYTCIHLSDELHEEIDGLFNKMSLEYSEQKFGNILLMACDAIRCITLAFRGIPNGLPINLKDDVRYSHVTTIIDYINAHLQDFNFNALARDLYLSKYYICHIFKDIVGQTVQSYLLKKRLETAQLLLSETDYQISKIAMDLGFGSFSVFSRNFHRIIGCTPREYRNKHQ